MEEDRNMMESVKLFPAEYRAFCCGPLSVCVERFGGINSVSLLDVREFGGKEYPDRFPVPWLARDHKLVMRKPLFSPGIQFRHGREFYVPKNPELEPFGFSSPDYSMACSRDSVVFRFRSFPEEWFSMTLSERHLPEGQFPSLKNHLAVVASGIQWLPDELRGPGFDARKPFVDGEMTFHRKQPLFSEHQVILEADSQYFDYKKKQFWVMDFRTMDLTVREIPHGWEILGKPSGGEFEIGWGFGETLESAREHASRAFQEIYASGRKNCVSPLQVEMPEVPGAAEFFRVYPGYQRHLVITESDREMSIRAAADKYGFFAMWDHIYPIRDFLLFGDIGRAEKALRYMITYPWAETCPWITIQLLPAFNEYLAFADNRDFLMEAMPFFRRSFQFNLGFVNQETGLLATSMNCGVDCSKEAGLDGLFYASCLNGWWYDSLRVLENFAWGTGDDKLADQAREISRKIEDHYAEVFFDPAVGYLRSAVKQDGSLPDVAVYQNTHTLGLDYAYGEYLMRNLLKKLACYQAEKLYHPTGHCAVSYDSEIPFEMWKAVHMNQHLGHECKCARWGGLPGEADRVMKGYLEYFTRLQCAVETFNLAGCKGDVDQQANWQAFSATGAAQALLCGVAGWMKHRGGWCWSWGGNTESVIRQLDGMNFTVTGTGDYAAGLVLDGVCYSGTMQIPADSSPQDCRVERSPAAPEYPVLLQAAELPVNHVEVRNGTLSFVIGRKGHGYLKIFAPVKPAVLRNGQIVDFEWNEQDCIAWLDDCFCGGDLLQISCEK